MKCLNFSIIIFSGITSNSVRVRNPSAGGISDKSNTGERTYACS